MKYIARFVAVRISLNMRKALITKQPFGECCLCISLESYSGFYAENERYAIVRNAEVNFLSMIN